jgi:regulatory protein
MRSEKEIIERLRLKKFPPAVIAETIAFLRDKRFVDDAEFAKAWVTSRLQKPLGLRRIRAELQIKGIATALIENAWHEAACDYSEDAVVTAIAQRHFKRLKNIDAQTAQRRIFGYLLRRGFSPDTITQAIDKL